MSIDLKTPYKNFYLMCSTRKKIKKDQEIK